MLKRTGQVLPLNAVPMAIKVVSEKNKYGTVITLEILLP